MSGVQMISNELEISPDNVATLTLPRHSMASYSYIYIYTH